MKRMVCWTLALILMFSLGLAPAALAEDGGNIEASGAGKVMIDPEYATISLRVEETDRDIAKAQSVVNEGVAAVKKALMEMGITSEDIAVGGLRVEPQYEESKLLGSYAGGGELAGYKATHSLTVRVRDIDSVGKAIDAALESGATALNDLSFGSDQVEAAYRDALALAVQDGAAKAKVMADALGLKLKGIESIRENSAVQYGGSSRNYDYAMSTNAISVPTDVAARRICVTADATVSMEIDQ